MPELHRCYRGSRCTHHETDPDYPTIKRGAPINAAEGLCDACTRHLRQAIVDMPRDYLDLETTIAGTRDGLRQLVAGTPELPVPISLTIASVQAELLHEAQCWAESTAEVLGVWWDTQKTQRSRPGVVLERAKHVLTGGLSAFLALRNVVHTGWVFDCWTTLDRDGLDGALVLLDLHYRARALTGQRRLVNHLPVPCPNCDHMALIREDGDETIECRACAQRYTQDEYERSCTLLARVERAA
ncbi:hypothetical protein [Amycolatopsis anabasis]|uniref:hypothetical protein n=1 Tax=Amycolatopsis anabasis TaxID=1840409 RepID=UPI00131D5F8E|nr:hypothetical protein [Amycolatopsis anabasis]